MSGDLLGSLDFSQPLSSNSGKALIFAWCIEMQNEGKQYISICSEGFVSTVRYVTRGVNICHRVFQEVQ